ncbi:unnamed protein product [Chilo suppressalis]|uniref:C2H2-type domain-containing protein n=1 Tax=Chilo suppressalis TaxID=168631 RepID=A0ABN8AQY3_CHISP|nr:hypothetical protein evm_007266 [Chilo suppressalis]CAH0398016.1 unnamed protein product [Chilo suppressalis]
MGSANGLVEETDPNLMEYALKKSLISRNKLAIILRGSNGQCQYCCVECPARYEEKEKLELHLCMHHKEYRFLCGICGTGLKRKEHLDRHTMEHQQVRPHVCQTCGKGFKRKEHLNIHQSIHKEDKTQVCSLCDRSFHRKDHLQKHLQTHSKLFLEQNMYPVAEQELLEIKCEIMDEYEKLDASVDEMECASEDLDSSDAFSESADVKTPDAYNDKPYVCEICSKSYKRKDHLKIHSWTHLTKDKICTECGKGFHQEDHLRAHMRVCIQVHMKQYQGNQTEEGMVGSEEYDPMLAQDLLVERRSFQDLHLRPHECPICHRRFKRKQHLKVHAKVHLNAKKMDHSIWCSMCGQEFKSNGEFEGHECPYSGNQNGPTNEDELAHSTDAPQEAKKENNKPTQPSMPTETIESVDGASYLMVHDERDIPVPQRVYVCRYCSKPFKRKDHYKIHLHIHTGVRSFFCQHCGKGFYRKDHLQKHAQIHARAQLQSRAPPKKQLPGLLPLSSVPKKEIKPEITIHAPSNSKLRVPLQIKVPYQVVLSNSDGEQRSVTIDPQNGTKQHEIFT